MYVLISKIIFFQVKKKSFSLALTTHMHLHMTLLKVESKYDFMPILTMLESSLCHPRWQNFFLMAIKLKLVFDTC